MKKFLSFFFLSVSLNICAQDTQAQIDSIMTLYPNCTDYPTDVLIVLDSLLVALANEENNDTGTVNELEIDSLFIDFLATNYPSVLQNGEIVANEAAQITALNLNSLGLYSLTGIEHFTGLETLECKSNNLVSVPELSENLKYLDLRSNNLNQIAPLPDGLLEVDLRYNSLPYVPFFPNSITNLKICYNDLNVLPNLPDSLEVLFCAYNYLIELPPLPSKIQQILCYNNQINVLEYLPESIETLRIQNNNLSVFPDVPEGLQSLNFSNNPIVCVKNYPVQFEDDFSTYSNCFDGCTDSTALNYNQEANNPDNSCTYLPVVNFPDDLTEINTGINATYLIEEVSVNNTSIDSGYVLGAFYYNDQGSLSCGGAREWNGGPESIAVYLDDETTDEKDGFEEGDEIIWLAYQNDSSDNSSAIFLCSIHFISGTNLFAVNSINLIATIFISDVTATFGCKDPMALNYEPTASLNDFSCQYQHQIDLAELNDSIAQLLNLVNALNEDLSLLLEEAYTDTLVTKIIEDWNVTIGLQEGWNMFGYGCPEEKEATEVFAVYQNEIEIAKDNFGNAYLTEYNFNGIGFLTPGMGYQIKVNASIPNFNLCDWYLYNPE